MNDSVFHKLVDKQILECRWADISTRWLNFIPEIEPAGSAPDVGLSEVITFTSVVSEIEDFDTAIRKEAIGVREYVFREAVFLLHKAFHVLSCSENQVKKGYKTWSLTEAYQASMFGAKSILYFCGIGLAEYNNKAVLVDVFPKIADIKQRRKQKLRIPDDPTIQFIKLNMKFEHRHVWYLFQRLLNVFDMNVVWQDNYIKALRKLGPKDFAKQRNELNYGNDIWIFDDLHNLVIDTDFGEHPTNIETSLVYSLKSDFSICLALIISRMAFLLFEGISQSTNILNAEIRLLSDKFNIDHHPLYKTAFE